MLSSWNGMTTTTPSTTSSNTWGRETGPIIERKDETMKPKDLWEEFDHAKLTVRDCPDYPREDIRLWIRKSLQYSMPRENRVRSSTRVIMTALIGMEDRGIPVRPEDVDWVFGSSGAVQEPIPANTLGCMLVDGIVELLRSGGAFNDGENWTLERADDGRWWLGCETEPHVAVMRDAVREITGGGNG